ncbi:OLC1v1032417C1 [Oldenlandia corymbosa var. corymbosa]|uniref:OLC1v1032417C1 n=1 Tax=Oldenlandia corymbosa var. corymbosa TaxID=529605 RepID=A0AAV1CP63_OLDCO|nr:OLC1v1032417C1 [Oldenlandia corymbosa var. corymbosa]
MFTPQKNSWSALSLTPRGDAATSARSGLGGRMSASNPKNNLGKGKAVAYFDGPPPPPVCLLSENGEMDDGDGENMEDWRRFKEAGLLDEVSLERRDKAALLERVSKLENELLDYQHCMGLLLIEKKEWTAKFDELRESLAEGEEELKRERAAHLIALAEAEKREDNLRKALNTEKQCVADLEKALRESRVEYDQIKLNLGSKLSDANALMSEANKKYFEVEEKWTAADAKLTEASRKALELDKKLLEIETRESVLRKQRMSLKAEQEAHEAKISKHKEDMREWEKKLQETEERQCEGRRSLNEKEERANEFDKILKQREKKLEEEVEKINLANLAVKSKEENLKRKLELLCVNEEKAESMRKELEAKEKELSSLAEKLNTKERVEIQKLLDEQRRNQDLEKRQFETELENRRKLLDEELKEKADALDKKEAEISHEEEKLRKRELAVESKSDRIKEKEKDIEAKLKILKEKEKSMKDEEKCLDSIMKEIASEKDSLQVLKLELEKMKAEISQKQLKIQEEIENLRVTDADRREHTRLQNELKAEIEKCMVKKELLLKEEDDLKQDRKKFEEEWEALDEKRVVVIHELQQLEEAKERLQKMRHVEEEKLQSEKIATKEYIERELEALNLEKESFAANMRHEQSALTERSRNEHDQLQREYEALRRDLEINMLKKQEEMEKTLQEKERMFEVERDASLRNIHDQKEKVMKEIEDLSSERNRIKKDRHDIAVNRKQLEEQRIEMGKDSNELFILSKKLKDQRESFIQQRGRFLAFIERLKYCKDCGEIAQSYVLADLQLAELEHKEISPLPVIGDELLEKVSSYGTTLGRSGTDVDVKSSESGGRVSWLRKCTSKIFKFSPTGIKHLASESTERAVAAVASEEKTEEPTIAENITPIDFEEEQSVGIGGLGDEQTNGDGRDEQGVEDSHQSEQSSRLQKPGKNSTRGPRRTKSVKAVVEDAAKFLGKTSELPATAEEQGKDVPYVNNESRAESSFADKGARKRARAQSSVMTGNDLDAEGSEGQSESVTVGGRRKRRQTTAPSSNTGEMRYNLRRPRTVSTAVAPQASVDSKKRTEATEDVDGASLEPAQNAEVTSRPVLEIASGNHDFRPLVQVTSYKRVETQQISSHRVRVKRL